LLEVLRAAEALWNASRVFFSRWDLSPSQFNVLNLLRDEPAGLSQTDLSRRLIMHRSNLTGLVDRLEERGLVARRERAADRRAWEVVLTPGGRHLLERILPRYYRVAEEACNGLAPARARSLAVELRRLGAHAGELAEHLEESHDRQS
jgi:MarR family 2-MHQ and catechol resistance regulon transcriptional repressor